MYPFVAYCPLDPMTSHLSSMTFLFIIAILTFGVTPVILSFIMLNLHKHIESTSEFKILRFLFLYMFSYSEVPTDSSLLTIKPPFNESAFFRQCLDHRAQLITKKKNMNTSLPVKGLTVEVFITFKHPNHL